MLLSTKSKIFSGILLSVIQRFKSAEKSFWAYGHFNEGSMKKVTGANSVMNLRDHRRIKRCYVTPNLGAFSDLCPNVFS